MVLSSREQKSLRDGGKILSETLLLLAEHAKEGVTPKELDRLAEGHIVKHKATPAFKGFGGFPACVCVSINEQVVHGIPDTRPMQNGDVVSFDCGVLLNGLYTDAARTVCIGDVCNAKTKKFIQTAEDAFSAAVDTLHEGVHVGDIGYAVQSLVEARGFGVVRALVGHGIGKELHGDPKVPNFGSRGDGPILRAGQAIAIEPMITVGSYLVHTASDGWTIVTNDKSIAAHHENTVLITQTGYEIITA